MASYMESAKLETFLVHVLTQVYRLHYLLPGSLANPRSNKDRKDWLGQHHIVNGLTNSTTM